MTFNRRTTFDLFKLTLLSFVIVTTISRSGSGAGTDQPLPVDWIGPDLKLKKFIDALPIPPVVKLSDQGPTSAPFTMKASQFSHRFHRDLPPAQVWGYNKNLPGPTIEVEKNHETRVLWQNSLPAQPLFSVPSSMPSAQGLPPVRTVVHLHGGSFPEVGYLDKHNNADGWPDSWNVPGDSQLATYPNTQDGTELWYHDHTTGITATNVYSGLAGTYLIRDSFEKTLKLPSGKFEVPLELVSRSFKADGGMYYPPRAATEFYGNTTTVNGKIWPYFNVEPRKYRFRILNASNARTYALKLQDQKAGTPGPAFYQIGSDGGLLEDTAILNDSRKSDSPRLNLAPGERADIIIDFAPFAGKTLVLNNNSLTDDEKIEPSIPDVMLFKVANRTSSNDGAVIPSHIRTIARLLPSEARRNRQIVLKETDYPDGSQMLLMNDLHWEDAIVEKPLLNSVEVWNIVNTTSDPHPFHIHLIQFQLISRQSFDPDRYRESGKIVFTRSPEGPPPNESGWKDTIRSLPNQLTKIIMRFGPYPGHFVYHCHILEHEDMDMMRPFEVVADPALSDGSDK